MTKSLKILSLVVVGCALASQSSAREQEQQPHADHAEHHSQYADQESSGIASLSRREMEDLESGAGMGLARAAELNRYPGPKHVLELASELDLTAEQVEKVESIRAAMLEQARSLGLEIIEKERHLNMRFVHGHIDDESLRAATAEIATLSGALRFAHLRAHLQTRAILSSDQVDAYDRLRGYRSDGGSRDD